MEFKLVEEAREFYNSYAKRLGFRTKVMSSVKHHVSGEVIKKIFSCSKEGKKRKGSSSNKVIGRSSTCDCAAHILVQLHSLGSWRIARVELGHMHPLSPTKARFHHSPRKLNETAKRRLAMNDKVGIPVAKTFLTFIADGRGADKVSFLEKDYRNYLDKERKLRLGEGDGEAIRLYFTQKKTENSNFFHVMDISPSGHLENVFWADARAREAYKYFKDVISFDSTYLTNKYDMPFAPFIGVNYHWQSVLLGCGLLSSETIQSYE